MVEEGIEAKVAVQWVLLPNGTYWIGEELVDLSGGQLEPTKAASWELPADRGKARAAYTERVAALEAGRSMAGEVTEARAQADADMATAHAAEIAALKKDHEAALAELSAGQQARHAADLRDRLLQLAGYAPGKTDGGAGPESGATS